MTTFKRRSLSIGSIGEVAILDFGDPARAVDVVFSHGNGFNAMLHRDALSALADRLRIIAVDQRGHGRTTLPAAPHGRENWFDLADDLEAVIVALGLSSPVVLAGHSMGGSVSLLTAPRLGERVKAVALFDPVIGVRMLGPDELLPDSLVNLAEMTTRRRAVFESRAAAIDAYRGRSMFAQWPEAALADYVEDGFVEYDEGVRLACDPAWEASNFRAQRQPMFETLVATAVPTRILKAAAASTCHVDGGDPRITANPLIEIMVVEGTTHLLPVERPDLVREVLLASVRG